MKHLASPEAYWAVRYKDDYNVTVHPAMNGKFAAIALWGFYDESRMSFVRLHQPWDRMRPGERMEALERLGLAPECVKHSGRGMICEGVPDGNQEGHEKGTRY